MTVKLFALKLIYHHSFKQHDTGLHPENKKRLDVFSDLDSVKLPFNTEVIGLIHQGAYINKVKEFSALGESLGGETHTSEGSFEAAVYAVNATILASEQGDFALVRPPGHHAFPGRASGFCIFNNIAVAAQRLVEQGKKVLILDFDGHLGDGTSKIFEESDQVMYWSIHEYPAYPGHGSEDEIGIGPGKGYTINIPLPPGSGDDIFMDGIQSTLSIVKQFEPDVVAVSAGFDSHQYDLLLDLRLSVNSFYKIGKILSANFKHIFAALEGGYNIEELPKCVYNFVDGINGDYQRFKEKSTESAYQVWQEYNIRIDKLLVNLSPYWKI